MSRTPSFARVLRGMLLFLLLLALVTGQVAPANGATLVIAAPALSVPALIAPALTAPAPVQSVPAAVPAAPVLEIAGGDPPIQNVAAIDGGGIHSCLLLESGAVQCWGPEDYIGRAPAGNSTRPVNIESGNKAFTQISAGMGHSCGVTTDARVLCWGEGLFGELGNGFNINSEVPVPVSGLSDVKSVSAGTLVTCAVTNAGEVWCWGSNAYKHLGNATDEPYSNVPLKVPNLTGITDVSVGYFNACVVTSAGTVQCWGDANAVLGMTSGSPVGTPQQVPVLSGGATAVSVGMYFACALVSASVQCWGANGDGELGQGSTSALETIPATATGLESDVTALSVGDSHGCAIQNTGLKCWGYNGSGQVGNGTTTAQYTPVDVPDLQSHVIDVGVGSIHSCAVLADSTARCWGSDADGRLGTGANTPLSPPVKVTALISPTTAVDTGRSFTCAITGGALKCWGLGTSGQLGNDENESSAIPVQAEGLESNVTDVATGGSQACAVMGTAYYCWGQNFFGELGIGNNDDTNVPTGAGYGTNVQMATGMVHTCAAIDGSAFCWGEGDYGKLGNGDTLDSNSPVGVSGFSPGPHVAAVDGGDSHSCAVIEAGPLVSYVYCWGLNHVGQLGDGTNDNSSVPTQVLWESEGDPIQGDEIAISTGASFTCGIFDGAAKCWGVNTMGQLGTGNNDNRSLPTQVSNLSAGVTAISAGDNHACAIMDGSVVCWGSNYSKQLGNSNTVTSNTALSVFLPGSALAVAAGADHTCAIVGDDLYCWGGNDDGQIGIDPYSVPQVVAAGDPQPFRLTLQVEGGGSVSSSPLGINCGTSCIGVFLPLQGVNLTASPFAGGALLGWGGLCSGTPVTCQVTMDGDKTVSVNFKPFYSLAVSAQGTGSVTSVPAGIVCPTNCLVSAVEGTSYTLTAQPGTGQKFVEWVGECGGEDETCTVTLTEDLATTVYFEPQVFALNVNSTGLGSITIDPGGTPCNQPNCTGSFAYNTPVSISAVGAPGWAFDGWTGACSGKTSPCFLNMSQARTVGATFVYVNNALDSDSLSIEFGFAYPQDAPHTFGQATYSGQVDAGDTLVWTIHEGPPKVASASDAPTGSGPFAITPNGELILIAQDIALGNHLMTVSLSDSRGSTIAATYSITVAERIFAPLVDSK